MPILNSRLSESVKLDKGFKSFRNTLSYEGKGADINIDKVKGSDKYTVTYAVYGVSDSYHSFYKSKPLNEDEANKLANELIKFTNSDSGHNIHFVSKKTIDKVIDKFNLSPMNKYIYR